jgi:hypothetical protein
MSWFARLMVIVGLVGLTGCGVLAARRTDFPAAAETETGNQFFVEDIRAIVNDPQLTEIEKREALAELGIEDDDLISALLTLP